MVTWVDNQRSEPGGDKHSNFRFKLGGASLSRKVPRGSKAQLGTCLLDACVGRGALTGGAAGPRGGRPSKGEATDGTVPAALWIAALEALMEALRVWSSARSVSSSVRSCS